MSGILITLLYIGAPGIEGASRFISKDFLCETVHAEVNGASSAEVCALRAITGTRNGMSRFHILGNPPVNEVRR